MDAIVRMGVARSHLSVARTGDNPVNDQHSEITPSLGRRTVLERQTARAAGVDRFGLPTARALGVAPRQLRKRYPELPQVGARKLSAELLRADRRLRRAAERHAEELEP